MDARHGAMASMDVLHDASVLQVEEKPVWAGPLCTVALRSSGTVAAGLLLFFRFHFFCPCFAFS